MNVLDLFSGIGGFSLGLERAGMRTVAFCEIDPYCRAVLAKHWPDVPVFGDVREFTADTLGIAESNGCGKGRARRSRPASTGQQQPKRPLQVDVICGGFPCQDISVAGKGAGIEGSRSGLWSEYARIIGEVRPKYVIVENVAALLGRGLERVLGDLAALGFDAEWHCIPASAVGAPHRRDRVWIIADANGKSMGRLAIAWGECGQWLVEPDVGRVVDGLSFELDLAREINNGNCNCEETEPEAQVIIWRLLRAMWEHRAIAAASPDLYRQRLYHSVPNLPQGDAQSRWLLGPRIEEDESLCSLWQDFYAFPFEETRDLQQRLLERAWAKKRPQALGSRADRLRALGNAVVPQIPEIIGRAIMASTAQP